MHLLTQLKIYGAVIGGVAFAGGALVYNQSTELRGNYTLVDAKITDVKLECFIERHERKVIRKESPELAYMDCTVAPLVARQHGFDDTDIKRRATVTYRYRSPVDDDLYSGPYAVSGVVETLVPGKTIRVHAHRVQPGQSRTGKGNLLVDDTGT